MGRAAERVGGRGGSLIFICPYCFYESMSGSGRACAEQARLKATLVRLFSRHFTVFLVFIIFKMNALLLLLLLSNF